MSDSRPNPDLLAAEYLLGLQDEAERRATAERLASDPDMEAALSAWAARLEPLTTLVAEATPSPALWNRIAQKLPSAAAPSRIAPRSAPGKAPVDFWPALAAGGFALAACLAVALLLSGHHLDVRVAWDAPRAAPVAAPLAPLPAPPPPPKITVAEAKPKPAPKPEPAPQSAVALLSAAGSETPAMKAFVTANGTVQLHATHTISVPPGKALGFWIWPHGTPRPTLVGRVVADGGTLSFPYSPADGTPVMVTLEPADLPYTGEQGPTLFQGQLVLLN